MKAQIKYSISIILVALSIIVPASSVAIYFSMSHPNEFILLGCMGILFTPALNAFRQKAQYEAKSDEFGMINSFEYKSMSGQERYEFDKITALEMERILSRSSIQKMTHKGTEKPIQALADMVGLSTVKLKVQEIAARIEFDKERNPKAKYNGHFVFYGSPGTGKTTVARILTGILYQQKCIKENKIIEVDGNTLKGSALGESATKVQILVKNAFGGVLFIDEAYSLNDGGKEAIDTLVKCMEDYRDRFVLIIAGYTKPMSRFLDQNEGLKSRFNHYLEFSDYNNDEARAIFTKMANNEQLCVSAEAIERFEEKYSIEKIKNNHFGNARTIRNILDDAISCHAFNIKKGHYDANMKYILQDEDIKI